MVDFIETHNKIKGNYIKHYSKNQRQLVKLGF